ncbi:MAG: response regulator [Candidatus Omnitrophica bacterium]|nr:response regulator [Candidatus Omnitrophota bacterium]
MRKKRILVVDDEASFTRLVKFNLEATGNYEVREENWGDRVLAAVKDFSPDLILLDIIMPGEDGGEVAAKLQAHPHWQRIPLVFLTAAVKKEEIGSSGGRIGGFAYLAKPVDMEELIHCIERNVSA